jgi:hypothetical protein
VPQIILVGSYIGLSDYVYDVTCTGRRLSITEAAGKGLFNQKAFKGNKIDYAFEWYEVNAGDRIQIHIADDDDSPHTVTFIVPDTGLPNPPLRWENTHFNELDVYLAKHCKSE